MDDLRKLLTQNAMLRPQVFRKRVVSMSPSKMYSALKNGEIEGAFQIGREYYISTAPWRRKLGFETEQAA